MRFWMRLLSSGSVTSVQSTSLGLDLDFLGGGLEVDFLSLSEPCLEVLDAISLSFSVSVSPAAVADLFTTCLGLSSFLALTLAGSDLVRRGSEVGGCRGA